MSYVGEPDRQDMLLERLKRHYYFPTHFWGDAPSIINRCEQEGTIPAIGYGAHLWEDLCVPFHTTLQGQQYHLDFEQRIADIFNDSIPSKIIPKNMPFTKYKAQICAFESSSQLPFLMEAYRKKDDHVINQYAITDRNRAFGYTLGWLKKFM